MQYGCNGACHRLLHHCVYGAVAKIKSGGTENFYTQ